MRNPTGRVNYEPNSVDRPTAAARGSAERLHPVPGRGGRGRSCAIAARALRRPLQPGPAVLPSARRRSSRSHIADAFTFELSKVETPAIRERLVCAPAQRRRGAGRDGAPPAWACPNCPPAAAAAARTPTPGPGAVAGASASSGMGRERFEAASSVSLRHRRRRTRDSSIGADQQAAGGARARRYEMIAPEGRRRSPRATATADAGPSCRRRWPPRSCSMPWRCLAFGEGGRRDPRGRTRRRRDFVYGRLRPCEVSSRSCPPPSRSSGKRG